MEGGGRGWKGVEGGGRGWKGVEGGGRGWNGVLGGVQGVLLDQKNGSGWADKWTSVSPCPLGGRSKISRWLAVGMAPCRGRTLQRERSPRIGSASQQGLTLVHFSAD